MPLQKHFVVPIKSPLRWRFTGSLAAMALFGLVQLAPCMAAPFKIVQQGKSTFSIVVPKVAAKSVNDAAAEMQREISVATGAKLHAFQPRAASGFNFSLEKKQFPINFLKEFIKCHYAKVL